MTSTTQHVQIMYSNATIYKPKTWQNFTFHTNSSIRKCKLDFLYGNAGSELLRGVILKNSKALFECMAPPFFPFPFFFPLPRKIWSELIGVCIMRRLRWAERGRVIPRTEGQAFWGSWLSTPALWCMYSCVPVTTLPNPRFFLGMGCIKHRRTVSISSALHMNAFWSKKRKLNLIFSIHNCSLFKKAWSIYTVYIFKKDLLTLYGKCHSKNTKYFIWDKDTQNQFK